MQAGATCKRKLYGKETSSPRYRMWVKQIGTAEINFTRGPGERIQDPELPVT